MKQQKLLSLIRQAIQDYNMIEDGDRIAVGVSGGKDSLTLLYAMKLLQEFYPKRFELSAITCNVGFEGMDFTGVADFCKHLEIPYEQVNTEIARIVFQENKDTRPCSLCAKLRKGAMYQRLGELGINKMAYAHNKDDFIETALMSLIYEGRFYAFPPVTELPGRRFNKKSVCKTVDGADQQGDARGEGQNHACDRERKVPGLATVVKGK